MTTETVEKVVECIKAHECPLFGDVPKGSRWAADHPVVAANPKAFKAAKE